MNIWDILILALVAGAVILALLVLRGKKKTGGCSCGCGECSRECDLRERKKD